MTQPKNQDLPTQVQLSGCLVRLGWMLVGHAALVLCAALIAQHTRSFLSPADLAFWAVAALTIGVRYLDIRKFAAQTVMGEPATMAHWRRYALMLVGVALVLWGLAHVVARWS
jgi:hypothetical protein